MNQTKPVQIIIVDDEKYMRDPIRLFATAKRWIVLESDGVKPVHGLQPNLPTIVLLDYLLGGARPEKWLQRFRQQYPKFDGLIYVCTGHDSEKEVAKFVSTYELAGVLRKPLDLTRLPTLLEKRPSATTELDALQDAAENLNDLAIRILNPLTLQSVYENRLAREAPKSKGDVASYQVSIQRLAKRLKEEESHVMETEWSRSLSSEKCWIHRHLSKAGQWYWLEEVKRETNPQRPEELALLFRTSDKQKQLEILANILRQEWGITRVRFYRVCPLYFPAGSSSAEDEKYQWEPLWQVGLSVEDEKKWKQSHFLLDETHVIKEVFNSNKPYTIIEVNNKHVVTSRGLNYVEWGNATQCAKVPIRDQLKPVGLLCLDRRTNNQPADSSLAPKQNWGSGLADEEMKHIMILLDTVLPMLKKYVHERRLEWLQERERELKDMARSASQKSDARAAVEYMLGKIHGKWQALNIKQLRDIYLVLLREDNLLEAWAGKGPVWEKRQGNLFELVQPFKSAWKQIRVIHDFQKWIKDLPEKGQQQLNEAFGQKRQALQKLGSWLGIPLKQNNETFGILVIGMHKKFRFTKTIVESLEATATHLTPLLLWGRAEAKREWLIRALAHEYREPVNRLKVLMNHLPEAQQKEQAQGLLEYQASVITNLRILAGTYEIPKNQTVAQLNEVFHNVLAILKSLYPNVQIEGSPSEEKGPSVSIPSEVLYQIIFNLLENACKFTLPDKPVQIQFDKNDKGELSLKTRNHCAVPIPLADRKRIFLPYQRGSNPPVAKGAGIGLAVARQLAEKFGLRLVLSDPGQNDNPIICFILTFPMKGENHA